MNPSTEPAAPQASPLTDTNTVNEWLDALSTGACDRDAFLRGVGEVLDHAPDAGWELLALIDQYYRRNKISGETFSAVKTHLQTVLMGKGRGGEVSVPMPRAATPTGLVPPAPSLATTASVSAAGSATATTRTATPPERRPARINAGAAAAARPRRGLAAGDLLRDRYRIKIMLGQGGMGAVFEAIDQYRLERPGIDQRVAIKVLHPQVTQQPRLFTDLRREFQHLQSLSHPNIVRVHEFDRDGEVAFFTMEYLSGTLLTQVFTAHGSASVYHPYALAIVRDVGAAVAHAHARGVVHGDLNPANVFITERGEIRVLDFGASSQLRRSPWISEFENPQPVTVATPTYASCQLLEGETPDPRDDVYALACIAYELLTGNPPFREHSALQARTLRLTPRRPYGIGGRQWHALRAGLHFERERRPADMSAWLEHMNLGGAVPHLPELAVLTTARPNHRATRSWTAAALVLVVIGLGTGWTITHLDTVVAAQATWIADLKVRFANTMISQLWEDDHRTHTGASSEATPRGASEPEADAPPAAAAVQARPATPEPGPIVARAALAPASSAPPAVAAPPSTRLAPPSAAAVAQPIAALTPPVTSTAQARLELAADNVEVAPGESTAQIVVRRSRALRGDVSFSWWTESGTAKPGRDFTPVQSQIEHIDDGRSTATLAVPLIADGSRRDPRSFYIVIDAASDNATLGKRTLTMVTLPGAD